MSSNPSIDFTHENLTACLKDLAKEYRRLNGKNMRAEIVLIGGAAILSFYNFRSMTTDVDAIISASSSMNDAALIVGEKHNLPHGWLNEDFKKTDSYSPRLIEVSKHYRTYSNILDVRVVSGEYLIAMKLKAARKYKHDLSDVIGILAEHEKNENPISLDVIRKAVEYLYGSWDSISIDAQNFIEDAFRCRDFARLLEETKSDESRAQDMLLAFQEDYPDVTNQANVNDILASLKKKSGEVT